MSNAARPNARKYDAFAVYLYTSRKPRRGPSWFIADVLRGRRFTQIATAIIEWVAVLVVGVQCWVAFSNDPVQINALSCPPLSTNGIYGASAPIMFSNRISIIRVY